MCNLALGESVPSGRAAGRGWLTLAALFLALAMPLAISLALAMSRWRATGLAELIRGGSGHLELPGAIEQRDDAVAASELHDRGSEVRVGSGFVRRSRALKQSRGRLEDGKCVLVVARL